MRLWGRDSALSLRGNADLVGRSIHIAAFELADM